MPAISPISSAMTTPTSGSASSWARAADQTGELVAQRADGAGQLADAADQLARDLHPHTRAGVLKAPRDPGPPDRDRSVRAGEPRARAVDRAAPAAAGRSAALAGQPLAVHHEQAGLELGAGHPGDRQALNPFARRRPSDRQRVGRIRLTLLATPPQAPAISCGARRTTISPWSSGNRSLARHRPVVLDHPRLSHPPATAPVHQPTEPIPERRRGCAPPPGDPPRRPRPRSASSCADRPRFSTDSSSLQSQLVGANCGEQILVGAMPCPLSGDASGPWRPWARALRRSAQWTNAGLSHPVAAKDPPPDAPQKRRGESSAAGDLSN
jgi:hypothetical protein